MINCLFKSDKNMYKANLHCHTTISDGVYTPEKIKEIYKVNGYSIVAFTDHRILKSHSHLDDSEFLAINACEMDINQKIDKQFNEIKTYHFNLYAINPNITETPPLPQMDYDDIGAINKYIKDRIDEGFLISYNHPYWSLQTYEDYYKLENCFAMEIYNHGCEVEGYYGYNPQSYDEMLRDGNKLYCLSTDDNHNKLDDSFGGWTTINSDSLKYENVIDALKQGDFYSSQGPEIYEISIENNMLYVKCSNVKLIVVYTDGRKCYIKSGDDINTAEFKLSGNEKYIRLMCRDKENKDANSNAYWL